MSQPRLSRLDRAIVLSAFLFVGCFSSQPVTSDGQKSGAGESQPLGSLKLSSAALGQLTLLPTSCTAGGRQLFLGADFTDEAAGIVARLVVDPLEGPAVRVFASATPFDRSIVFRRPDCRAFHFSLESTGWRINRIDDYQVTLDLDCWGEGRDSIAGKVSSTHCH